MKNTCKQLGTRRVVSTLVFLHAVLMSPASWAGAYIFAGESNGVDVITHPSNYTGVGGIVNVGVCIDPGSANVAELEIPVRNVITVWNNLQPVEGNIEYNAINSSQVDAESVLLHEVGHCIGLAHVNLASESGLPGNDKNYTKSTDGANNTYDINPGPDGIIGSYDDIRGDDVNLHWFNPANDPFLLPIPTPVDTSQYSRNVNQLPFGDNWVVNADRTVSTSMGYLQSEAVMQQGSYFGEIQRELVSDDVSTILLAASGVDETAGTSDDYQLVLNYEGVGNGSNCDITVSISGSSFAYCSVGGSWIGNSHIRISTGSIFLGTGYNWYFNDQLIGDSNQQPTAVNDSVSVDEDGSVAITVLGNDSDPDNDTLNVSNTSNPANGNVVINANNTISYTPDTNFNGLDSFSYTISDGNSGSDSATVSVTVNAVNDEPVAADDSAGTEQNTAVVIDVLANDSDIDGDSLTVSSVTNGNNGTVTNNGSAVSYTPASGFSGQDTFSYTVTDNQPGSSDTATVTVTVIASNQAPTAAFSSNCSDLSCDFDASGSNDADGTIVSYSWNFGDGSNGSGPTPNHSYAIGGTYPVSLTVTDDDGATDTANTNVTVTAVPPPSTDPKLQIGTVSNVSSAGWTSVPLPESYTSMVVVASANYSNSNVPAVVRLQNAAGNSFQVRADNPSGAAVSDLTVHYVVVEAGVYNQAEHGITLEAVKYTSTVTDRKNGWVGESRSYVQGYTNPVVLGQVMSYNDPDWSVFWAQGSSRTSPPSATALRLGKHVGEDTDTDRADETIGYLVVEAGSGSVGNTSYAAGVGADIVAGMNNNPPYNYTFTAPAAPAIAVLSPAALDGGDGGWPVLYGVSPVSAGNLNLAFDEDQIGDSERSHTSEQVAYIVFGSSSPPPNQAPTADFSFDATGLDVNFTDLSSDSDGTIVSWSWDFGDGSGASTAQNPSYSYATEGTYAVMLEVTDDDGATDQITRSVTASDTSPGTWTPLSNDDFESGWGNWLDGGSDARLSSDFAIGAQALALQDNSSTSESELASSLNLTGYSELQIEFSYVVQSFENSEDFWVRYSSDDGVTWQTLQAYVNNVDFVDDGTRYDPVITIDSGNYTFNSNVKLKFECDASGNRDDVYIDNVRISAR